MLTEGISLLKDGEGDQISLLMSKKATFIGSGGISMANSTTVVVTKRNVQVVLSVMKGVFIHLTNTITMAVRLFCFEYCNIFSYILT